MIHEDKDVERVTIFGFGARHETEVIGKWHSGRKYLLQREYPFFGIERIFVVAVFRSLDDYFDLVIIVAEGLDTDWIRQTAFPVLVGHFITLPTR